MKFQILAILGTKAHISAAITGAKFLKNLSRNLPFGGGIILKLPNFDGFEVIVNSRIDEVEI